jgi:hypothetical protein
MPMADDPLLDRVAKYYGGRLAEHGPTARGVDWNSSRSQILRFEQFLHLFAGAKQGSIIDYGCGYGALVDFLSNHEVAFAYTGYDISKRMTETASVSYPAAHFTSDRNELVPADWCVASGIFNLKLSENDATWREHVLRTIDDMRSLSKRGFAFNALTSYADPDKKRQDLYYADPLALFDHCKRHISQHVALLHDYESWDFTLVVRIDGNAGPCS